MGKLLLVYVLFFVVASIHGKKGVHLQSFTRLINNVFKSKYSINYVYCLYGYYYMYQKGVIGGSHLSWIFWEHENLSGLSVLISIILYKTSFGKKNWAKWESGLTTVWLKWELPVLIVGYKWQDLCTPCRQMLCATLVVKFVNVLLPIYFQVF